MLNKNKKLFALISMGIFSVPLTFSLISTFKAYSIFFGDSLQGADRSEIKNAITESLFGVIGWPLIGLIVIFLIALLLDGIKYKERWVFWTLLFMGFLWLLCFPAGSFIGLAFLIYLFVKMKTFGRVREDP
jgi:hypothetical protein